MIIARRRLKVKVIWAKQRSIQNVCATRISTAGSCVLIDGHNSSFHCAVINCELARLDVQRGVADDNGSGGV